MNIAPAILPLFVYGTLLDPKFTANLLQHPVAQEPAVLHGYQVAELPGLGYPVLVEAPGRSVRGQLYRNLSAEDYVRLDAYEGVGERLYQRTSVKVVAGDSQAQKPETGAGDPEWVSVYLPTGTTLHRYG